MKTLSFKVLVHKETLQFGVFHEDEVWHCETPDLLGSGTTMEELKRLASPTGTIIKLKDPDELDDYFLLDAILTVNLFSPTI